MDRNCGEIWSELLSIFGYDFTNVLGTLREISGVNCPYSLNRDWERRLPDDLRLVDHMGETIIAIDDIP